MEISGDKLDWLSTDEENLAKFLDTETGKRFLPKLLESTPALLESGDTNPILIRTGVVRGYQEVARSILMLAHSMPVAKTETASAYPDLHNDAAWNDGQKLEKEESPKE